MEFAYDSQGRRISKRVLLAEAGSSTFVLKQGLVFLYDGWNMIAEIDITQSQPRLLRSYEWGLDVSETPEGAGGVGGLVVEWCYRVSGGTTSREGYAPCYDGNGNVMALVSLSLGEAVGQYEYGAFGETISVEGDWAVQGNPVRFSTKYGDAETGLVYYTHRYYEAATGRWLSRDPIGEEGGVNLYGMVGNDAVNQTDYLGLVAVTAIPDIMRANGMTNGAALMDHWFAGSGTTDNTTIKMSWVEGYIRARAAMQTIIYERRYMTAAAKKEIVAMLKRIGKYASGGTFGTFVGDTEILDKNSIQYKEVGSLYDPVDDMFAALGKFTLRVLVKGYVCAEPGNVNIRIDQIGIYVKDSYDFTGWQPLGFWNSKTNYTGKNPFRGDYVSNADFRGYGSGKDFKVFSDIAIHEVGHQEFNDP